MAVRLRVAGLSAETTPADLEARFTPFGSVSGVVLRPDRGFGFVSFVPTKEGGAAQCIRLYHQSQWRGRKLDVQVARPDFAERLRLERAAAAQPPSAPAPPSHARWWKTASDGVRHPVLRFWNPTRRLRKFIVADPIRTRKAQLRHSFPEFVAPRPGPPSKASTPVRVSTPARASAPAPTAPRLSTVASTAAKPEAAALPPPPPTYPAQACYQRAPKRSAPAAAATGPPQKRASKAEVHQRVSELLRDDDEDDTAPAQPALKPTAEPIDPHTAHQLAAERSRHLALLDAMNDDDSAPAAAAPAPRESKKRTHAQAKAPEPEPEAPPKAVEMSSTYRDLYSAPKEFTLFGADEDEEEAEEEDDEDANEGDDYGAAAERALVNQMLERASRSAPAPAAPLALPTQGPRFFFHLDEAITDGAESLVQPGDAFWRTEPLEKVTEDWESQRQELSAEYKRKHKAATRRRERQRGAAPA